MAKVRIEGAKKKTTRPTNTIHPYFGPKTLDCATDSDRVETIFGIYI